MAFKFASQTHTSPIVLQLIDKIQRETMNAESDLYYNVEAKLNIQKYCNLLEVFCYNSQNLYLIEKNNAFQHVANSFLTLFRTK